MNYWHIQMNKGLLSGETINAVRVREILLSQQIIGIGEWKDNKQDQCQQFKTSLKQGDIVMVRDGNLPIALVKVMGQNIPNGTFENERSVFIIDSYNDELDTVLGKYKGQAQGTLTIVKDKSNSTGKYIIGWYRNILKKMKIEKLIELLEYKKQIIIQGPPGTGKTRLAKEVAKDLSAPKTIGSHMEKIDEFFKNFSPNDPAVQENREVYINELAVFYRRFPKEKLSSMDMEGYLTFYGNFMGQKISPLYTSYYYPVPLDKKGGKIVTEFHRFRKLKNKNDDEAMRLLAEIVSDLVLYKDTSIIEGALPIYIGLKILICYYPEEYFPVHSDEYLKRILRIIGAETLVMDMISANQEIQRFFLEKKKEYNVDIRNFEFMKFLFDNFAVKGNSNLEEEYKRTTGEYKLIQFHPSYTYEDFVRSIIVETKNGHPEYKVVNKVMADFAQKALKNPSANYVLIIDEINRANLPSVLGELIYALEYRFDENNPDQTTVESMYSLKSDEEDEVGDTRLSLPTNLFIIGTMNSADRSVGHIDYAIRRRFAFVDVLPDEGVIEEANRNESVRIKATSLFKEVSRLFDEGSGSHLAPDFKKKDVQLGHSYFLAETMDQLELKLEYEIKPLLEEYLKDGILLDSAQDIIANLK